MADWLSALETFGREAGNRLENVIKQPGPVRHVEKVSDPPEGTLFALAHAPEEVADKVRIHTPLETGQFGPRQPPPLLPGGGLVVAAYNLERGMCFEEQVTLLKTHPVLKKAHVLLLNELDRGCSRSGCRHVARDLAKALGMNMVFGVEYVELPRKAHLPVNRIDAVCEHGNAILSPFPLENLCQIRHGQSEDWSGYSEQPRLGGVLTVGADIHVGGKIARFYAVHFSSNPVNERFRISQAQELAEHAKNFGGPVVVGGDMNTAFYTLDVLSGLPVDGATRVLREAGLTDAHASLPARHRGTTDKSWGVSVVIDLIFQRGLTVRKAGVVSPLEAGHLSDHLPVWAILDGLA